MTQRSHIPPRASRTVDVPQRSDVDDVPDSYYNTRLPTSTRRYYDTRGNQVIQKGNQRIVIHDEPPPRQRGQVHWLLIFGIGMIAMVGLFIAWNWGGTWWANHQLDATSLQLHLCRSRGR